MAIARADVEEVGSRSDAALLAAIAARDQRAFAALHERYGPVVLRRTYHLLGDWGAAEDVAQDVFWRVWLRAGTFDPARGTVRAWLLVSAHHAAMDQLRGPRGRALRELPLLAAARARAAAGADEAVELAIAAALVRQELASLPPRQREALELAYFEGLSVREIAEQTRAALGTVKGRLFLGRAKLRAALSPSLAI